MRQCKWETSQWPRSTRGSIPPRPRPDSSSRRSSWGLVVFSDQVASDDIDRDSTFQLLTPALTQKLQAGANVPGLRGSASGTAAATWPQLNSEIIRLVPKGTPYDFHVTSVTEGRVERSSKPEAIALGVFGAIAALAALLIAGQAISRALWADAGT